MDAGLTAPLLRVTESTDPGGLALTLPLGHRLAAQVVEGLGDGRWRLEVGGTRLVASTALRLAVGDRLDVIAARTGNHLDLRLVSTAARFDARQYALAALVHAGARPEGLEPVLAPSLTAALRETLASGARPAAVSQAIDSLVRLLAALDPRQPPGALAAALRRLLTDSGACLECRLREWIEGQTRTVNALDQPLSGEEALPASAREDLRVLLAAAARELVRGAPAETGDAIRTQSQALGDAALSRQVDLAYQWLRDRAVRFGVPVLSGDRIVTVDLRIAEDERGGGGSRTTGSAFCFDLHVDLPEIGRMHARVRWAAAEVAARFVVENDAVRSLVESELAELASSLRRSGVRATRAEVVVDPSLLTRPHSGPSPPLPPGGSIFSARA